MPTDTQEVVAFVETTTDGEVDEIPVADALAVETFRLRVRSALEDYRDYVEDIDEERVMRECPHIPLLEAALVPPEPVKSVSGDFRAAILENLRTHLFRLAASMTSRLC